MSMKTSASNERLDRISWQLVACCGSGAGGMLSVLVADPGQPVPAPEPWKRSPPSESHQSPASRSCRQITVSSELVPYQEIDVYAKESGYVKDLLVDYGTRVQKGQLMAVLEIPELEIQLKQDAAAIASATERVTHAQHEVDRLEAQHKPVHAQCRASGSVAKTRPGLVAQQEIDDAQGKDLALEAQVEAGKSALQTAQSQLDEAKAKTASATKCCSITPESPLPSPAW